MRSTTGKLIIGGVIFGLGSAALPAQSPSAHVGPAPRPGASATNIPSALLPPGFTPSAVVATEASSPKIQFATPVYDFGRIQCGKLVNFTYYFTNTGSGVLELSNVQAGCHCTTPGSWSKRVEAGDTGAIPVQFNSANMNGPVVRQVTVTCNDKSQPVTVLQLKGTVWKPIEMIPAYTFLNLPPDALTASATVRILNNTGVPLQVFGLESDTSAFRAELKTNTPGMEYLLSIDAVPPLSPGRTTGKFTLKTSAADTPVLTVPVTASVQPPIWVQPPQVRLPRTPLGAPFTPTIRIRDNSTNRLSLSEWAVNVPGVEVQMKEIDPGRNFSVVLTFPEGFDPAPNQPVIFTAKTSLPRMPLISVPVVSMPRLGNYAPPASPPPPPGFAVPAFPALPGSR